MEENITEVVTNLVIQLSVIIFAVRIMGKLAAKAGIPSVLGELVAGIIIGPYALGSIGFIGFPQGLFPLNSTDLAVNPELYSIGQIASIILLFASGIETDLSLFIKYSVSGGIIGFGGVAVSFIFGDVVAMLMCNTGFMDVRCLFLGIMSTATSVGITARILSDKKKMDSPEGVTILAAAVFDDVLGIVLLAVVMGIVSASSGGAALNGLQIGIIALRAFSIWLVLTVVCILLSKRIAKFVRLFGGTFDFSVCALGVAFLLAGIFEKQGLAMIIGAYTTGLALSRTDIAPVIQERIHALYKFFVPVFFAVMGMSVDVTQLVNPTVLLWGFIYTVAGIASKLIGCGGPALSLGFNMKGAFRIGAGMIPRGEVALIIAGIGLTAGIVDQELFGVVILMTLITTLAAPPILSISLKLNGSGTRKDVKASDSQVFEWDFDNAEITRLVLDMFIRDLRSEGFYVQMMNISEGISQARKGDVSISILGISNKLTIETAAEDMAFVKCEIYEIMLRLNKSLQSLSSLQNTSSMTSGFISSDSRVQPVLYKVLDPVCISCELKGNTKDEVIEEMINLLEKSGKVRDRFKVIEAVHAREKIMSTGLGNGLAFPHARTDGVSGSVMAIGIKKSGVNFDALDSKDVQVFVMIVSPESGTAPQMRVMSAISGVLMHQEVIDKIVNAKSSEEVISAIKSVKTH